MSLSWLSVSFGEKLSGVGSGMGAEAAHMEAVDGVDSAVKFAIFVARAFAGGVSQF